MTLLPLYRVAAGNSPLIRPAATFPRRGKALLKRLLPLGEAAARRRLMRGGFNSIVPLPSYRRKLAPHPACGHLPPQGKGSPQKASPFGRSCRPQAADEGGVRAVSLLMGSIHRLSPHPSAGGAAATFPRRGKAPCYLLTCPRRRFQTLHQSLPLSRSRQSGRITPAGRLSGRRRRRPVQSRPALRG